MDFGGGFRNHYNYFGGNGFNLRQEIFSLSAKSSAKEGCRPKFQNNLPSQCLESESSQRIISCPLPKPKSRFADTNQDFPPAMDDLPDNKLDFKGIEVIPEETLHFLVTGPPRCGKNLFIESLAKRRLLLPPDSGPCLAFNKSFAMLGIKVHANVWYMKNPKDCNIPLKTAFSDKNFAIILVYDVTVPQTLFDVREYILAFRRVFGTDVPIILVGNKTDMRTLILDALSNTLDWGLLTYFDGQQVKHEYKLAAFLECSAETGYGMSNMLYKASTVVLADYFKF